MRRASAHHRTGLIVLAALLLCGRALPAQTDEGVEFFEKKVRPVLAENCFGCHGAKKTKAHLRLDRKAGALAGGDSGPAIVPGDPEKSLLIKAVGYHDEALRMPPRSKMADARIADLARWVRMGAPWPDEAAAAEKPGAGFDLEARKKHWAFQPIRPAVPPAVRQGGWVRNPLDAFVLARLEAAGLPPAPAADPRTLLRRVTFDLTGLPPTPAEIDAYLGDPSPDAYAKVVDRLLASPAYGERWGRHWLDLVRYAETQGHEFDFDIPGAFAYRDYVIRALNADLPYDQFVLEHMAGDLLPEPRRHPTDGTNESVLGTASWFLGEAVHSPVDVKADEADRIDNQIDVWSKTFLGLTVACARCHDHKFDPITTRDYYSLAGYLEGSRYQQAFLDPPERAREALQRLAALHEQAGPLAIRSLQPADFRRIETRLLQEAGFLEHPLHPWRVLAAGNVPASEFVARKRDLLRRLRERAANVARWRAGSVLFEDFRTGYRDWFVTGEAFSPPCSEPQPLLGTDPPHPVRAVAPPHAAHSGLAADRAAGVLRSKSFVLSGKRIAYHVAGRRARINLIVDGYQLLREPIYGGLTLPVDHGDRFEWRTQDVGMWQGQRAYIELIDDGPGFIAVDEIRFSDDPPPGDVPSALVTAMLADPGVDSPEALAGSYQKLFEEVARGWRSGTPAEGPDREGGVALLNGMLQSGLLHARDPDPRLAEVLSAIQQAEGALPVPRRAPALADGAGWNEHVLIRGNPHRPGPEAPRRFLEAIAGPDQPAPPPNSGRLELARRMLDPSNPLPARVMVNRLWQHHFGEGLVRSVDNFGVLGEPPSHPELLDWLAAEFVRRGWSLKAMHRLMVLSNAYQMGSRPAVKEAERRDPDNRLLHRMPIFRLEAEAVRDAILSVSGRLDRRMFGPGVPPYLTEHMTGRGRPDRSGPLDGDGRRSVYLAVRRNFLSPLLLAFDYPIPFTTIGRRGSSNVPAQALALMNNPFVTREARGWVARVLAEPGRADTERLQSVFVTALGRPPSDEESREALDFLRECGASSDAGRPQAWADLCHVLFNVKEFIFIP